MPENVFFVVVVVVVVLGVGGVLAAIMMGSTTVRRLKALGEAIDIAEAFDTTHKLLGVNGENAVAIDEGRQKIAFFSREPGAGMARSKRFNYRDILSSEIVEDGSQVTQTSRASQVGGALLGGLIAGPLGALVGGVSGKTTTSGEVSSLQLRIVVNDSETPTHSIELLASFLPSAVTKKDGAAYRATIDQAREWHDRISVLIRRADQEDTSSAPPPSSVADA